MEVDRSPKMEISKVIKIETSGRGRKMVSLRSARAT
jgi:hypothetical protein